MWSKFWVLEWHDPTSKPFTGFSQRWKFIWALWFGPRKRVARWPNYNDISNYTSAMLCVARHIIISNEWFWQSIWMNKASTIIDFSHYIDQQRQLGRNRSTKLSSDPLFWSQNEQLPPFWLAFKQGFVQQYPSDDKRIDVASTWDDCPNTQCDKKWRLTWIPPLCVKRDTTCLLTSVVISHLCRCAIMTTSSSIATVLHQGVAGEGNWSWLPGTARLAHWHEWQGRGLWKRELRLGDVVELLLW